MKTIFNIYPGFLLKSVLFSLALLVFSCDEKEFLNEVPLDFYSPENSYITPRDFEAANLNLYDKYRTYFWSENDWYRSPGMMFSGTDLVYGAAANTSVVFTATLVPTDDHIYRAVWYPAYVLIYDANVVIGRADSPESQLTGPQKEKIKAEARFFRGYAYKMLANLYGGVPITLEETGSPKRDYVRATRQAVYQQAAEDLKFAAETLPDITDTDDSRVNRLAAYHLLSEVYISLERWQDAVAAASIVIDHPATALMTQRFGSRKNDPDFGGDVYWDMFRKGNQNRSAGNTESLWVLQFEHGMRGGGGIRGGGGGTQLERMVVPRLFQAEIFNKNGSRQLLIPQPNTFYYGRGIGAYRPTNYFFWEIWNKSGYTQDIRNSEFNIVRDIKVNNPASDYHGKWVIKDKVPLKYNTEPDSTRNFYPIVAKTSDPGKHPSQMYLVNQTIPGSLTGEAGNTYRDHCVIRLAETYLLRAEAYLGMNDQTKAAGDINVVRTRAKAPQIAASAATIDYILDERLRELHFEEFRKLTLMRLGKLVERTNKVNPLIKYQPHHNLWPIPFNDIEKNVGAALEQNPGYN